MTEKEYSLKPRLNNWTIGGYCEGLFTVFYEKEDKTMERCEHKLGTTIIAKNNLGDTRSADRIPSYAEFKRANDLHKNDVYSVMTRLATLIENVGRSHDETKSEYAGEFYRDFCIKITNPENDFKSMPWYQGHIKAERHHINDNCPEDVDLIDILEHIVDCVCAGKARSGEVYPVNISNDILQKAVENTQKLIEKYSIRLDIDEEPGHIEFT